MNKIIICLFLFSLSAFSSECEEYNLFETNNRLLDMPIQNQGNYNTCYAHSLSAQFEVTSGISLHPYSIAFEHKKSGLHWNPKDLNYSFSKLAWNDIRKNGACSKDEIKDQIYKIMGESKYNDDQFFYVLEMLFKYKNLEVTFKNLEHDPFIRGVVWKEDDLKKIYNQIPFEKYPTFFDYLENDFFSHCQKISPKMKIKTSGLGFGSNNKLSRKIKKYLTANSPAIIGYCFDYMKETPERKTSFPRIRMPIQKKCGAHYVLAVGQANINNQCQILIRNSHGKDFWGDKDQTCLCQSQNGDTYKCLKKDFNNTKETVLGCYFNKNQFLNQTFEVSHIE